MTGYNQAANEASQRWQKTAYDRIVIRVPKGWKDRISAELERRGESVNGFGNKVFRELMNVSAEEWVKIDDSIRPSETDD